MKRLVLALLVAAVSVAVYWALKSPLADDFLLRRLPRWAAAAGIEAAAAELDFDPWGPSLVVRDLRLGPTGGEWSLSVRFLRVRLRFLKTLSGTVHLELETEAPRFEGTIARGAPDGGEKEGAKGGGVPRFAFEVLSVSEGSASVEVPGANLRIDVPSVEVRWGTGRGFGRVAGASVTWLGETERLTTLEFEGRRRYAAVDVDRLELVTDHLRLRAKGRAGPWRLLDLGVEAGASLDGIPLAWAEALRLSRFTPLGGDLELRAQVGGTTALPDVKGALSLTGGRLGALTGARVRADWSADRQGLGFSGLEVGSSAGGVRGFGGRLSWGDGLRLEARGEAAGYDLRAFMGLFSPRWFPVGVRASGAVEAEGPLLPEMALRCRIDVEASGLDVTTHPGDTPVFELPRARVASRLTVGKDGIVFGATRVEADSVGVAISKGRIEYRTGLWFDTDVAVRDLEVARRYVPQGIDAEGVARGRFGGPYAELVFDYDLDLRRVVILGEEAGRLEGRVHYDLRDLSVDGLAGSGPLGSWSADGAVGLRRDGRWDLEARWNHGDLSMLRPLLKRRGGERVPDLGGEAAVSGRLLGVLAAPVFEGSLSSGGLTVGGVGVEALDVRGTASRDGWTLAGGSARALGGEVAVEGTGGSGGMQISGEVRGIEVAQVMRLARRDDPVEGTASAEFQVSGRYGDPTGLATVRLTDVAAFGWGVGEVEVSVRAAAAKLEGEARAFGEALVLRGEVGLGDEWPFHVDLDLKGLPWGVLPPAASPEGLEVSAVTARAQVSGRGTDLPGSLEGAWSGVVEGVRWRWAEVGALQTGGRLGAEGFALFAEAWDGELRVEVDVPAEAGEPVVLEVAAEDAGLSRLTPPVPLPDGRANLRGRVLLSRERWAAAEGAARLAAFSGLELEGKTSPLVLPGGVVLPPWSLHAETVDGSPSFELVTEGLSVEGAFRDLVAGEWAASFRAEGFEPGRLLPEGRGLADLRGALTGAGEADGTFEGVREARASGKLVGLGWRFVTPADWTWDTSWEEGALGVRAEDTRGLRAEATWTAQEGVRAVLDAEEVALGSLMADPRVPEDASGEATGRIEVRLPPGRKVSATARFPSLRLSLPPVVLENREEIRLSYDAERLGVESLSLGGDQLEIAVQGGGGVDGGWDLQATVTGDLAAARQWSRHVRRASGKHRLDLEVRGPWERPRVSGSWEVTSGATLFVEGFGQPIEDLDAAIVLDPDQGIRVRWIDAQVGAGRVHVEGGVGLDGFRPSKLRLSAELRDIRYEWPPKVSYGLDADLLVTGTAGKPELRGEIRLEEFLYARRLNLKTLTLELLKPRARAVAGMPMEGRSVFVDLAVRGVGDLRVENNFADVRLGVDLRARGHLPKPVLWGRVEVLEGTVRARGVEYEMRRSAVEFLGETRPVPLLDVHATTAVQQYDISVDVTGPLDGYQVLLSSLPPLAENDIVALLSVGATTSELPDADALAAVQAASYATGGLQDNLEEGVGEFLGIDQLSVDPSYSSAAQTTMTRITVGKAITRSLFARYSAAVGGTAEQDVEVQYNLAPRVSLLGTWTDRPATAQAGERGSLGGEIRFRFPFR